MKEHVALTQVDYCSGDEVRERRNCCGNTASSRAQRINLNGFALDWGAEECVLFLQYE